MSGEWADTAIDLMKVIEGYHKAFQKHAGAKRAIVGEPPAGEDMLLYTLFDDADFDEDLSNYTDTVRLIHRLLVAQQSGTVTETKVIKLVQSVPDAVRRDPTLGGKLPSGMARIISARGVFVTFGETVYRAVDFRSETVLEPSDRWQEE